MRMCHLKIKCISVEPLGSITRVIVKVVTINRTCWQRISETSFSSHMLRNSTLTEDPKSQLAMQSF